MMNTARFRNPLSLTVILLLFALIVYLRFYFPIRNIISWDVFGYYLYLPALFIHNDLGLRNMDWVHALIEQYQNTSTFYQGFPGPDGTVIMKYSCGMAVMYSPFFFLAHILAPSLGYAADGLSQPYQYAMVLGGLVYTLTGLLIIRKLLLSFFTDRLSAWLLLLVVAGTNYLEMAYAGGLLSHNVLFALYALVLLMTHRFYLSPARGKALSIGLTLGLITLIRPTDMILGLVPLLWGVDSRMAWKERLRFFRKEIRVVLFCVVGFGIMGLPQILYWKMMTGKFLYYSYINPGEGFDFLFPHTWDFLFSFRKGWLIYTPLMWLALVGMLVLYRHNRKMFWPVATFTILYLYVVSSWSCWWYAGSFSARPMVQAYPVLALPLGFLFVHIRKKARWLKGITYTAALLFLCLNLFQLWQYSFRWIIDSYRMTAPYYFAVFGNTHDDPQARKLLMVDRTAEVDEYFTDSAGYTGRTILYYDFEKDKQGMESKICDTMAHSGRNALWMDTTLIYSPGITLKYKEITKKDHSWIRATVWVYSFEDPVENPLSLVISFTHKGANYKYRAADLEKPVYKAVKGAWTRLQLDYITPEVRTRNDKVSIYCWLRGKQAILIDDLKVEVFEPGE